MESISVQVSGSALPGPQEMALAAEYLISTRDKLVETVSGLSDPQWNFKPAPDRWSIAEILEHLAIIEGRIQTLIGNMPNAPEAAPDRNNSEIERIIMEQIPKRATRIQAPPPLLPVNQWSPAEGLTRFVEGRHQTLDLLTTSQCLRGRVLPHPVLGEWDGYQWILATASHTARHTGQVLEVKASADFPEAAVRH